MAAKTITVAFLIASVCAIPIAAQRSLPKNGPQTQDFASVVIPITELRPGFTPAPGVETRSGTGFCLDPACQFIATNYHIAMIARPRRIAGEAVVQRFLATGPDDEDATLNEGQFSPSMKYSLSRDLAIFQLRRPLSHYHGLSFQSGDLRIGQEVDIYSYPRESAIHSRTLLQVHGKFQSQSSSGLLVFDYDSSDGRVLRPGASGGIVVDRNTRQIVGVLNGIDRGGKTIAFAVPVRSLEKFVCRVQPYLAKSIFPSTQSISPISADLYPQFVPAPDNSLQHRPQETVAVRTLRSKAQFLADGMRDFVAVQTFAWGSQDNEPLVESKYELQVVSGDQRFREFPNGKKDYEYPSYPPLNRWIIPGDEWSKLPAKVGTDRDLKIHQAPDAVMNGRTVKIFQYWASVEDDACSLRTLTIGLFTTSKTSVLGCYGEVWTDENLDILRMSEHFEVSGKWSDVRAVVTYGWLDKADGVRRLIPLTIAIQGQYKNKVYWCHGQFTDYRLFATRVRIVASTDGPTGRASTNEIQQ
jgi:hypothetical protein